MILLLAILQLFGSHEPPPRLSASWSVGSVEREVGFTMGASSDTSIWQANADTLITLLSQSKTRGVLRLESRLDLCISSGENPAIPTLDTLVVRSLTRAGAVFARPCGEGDSPYAWRLFDVGEGARIEVDGMTLSMPASVSTSNTRPAADAVSCTSGAAGSPGSIALTDSKILGAFSNGIWVAGSRCDITVTGTFLTAQETPITQFSHPDHRQTLTVTGSQFRSAGYWTDAGDVHGHGLYVHPNVVVSITDTRFQNSLGTGWKHYSEEAITDSSSATVTRGTFVRNREGFEGSTVGTVACIDCTLSRTQVVAGWSMTFDGGSLSDLGGTQAFSWISGTFGSGENLPGTRQIRADTMTISVDGPLAIFNANYETGQSFRVRFTASDITADQTTLADLVSGDSGSDGETLILDGGTLTCTRCKKLWTMGADQTLILDGGVTLSGEPDDGCWVDNSAGGIVTNTSSNVTSTAPLLCD